MNTLTTHALNIYASTTTLDNVPNRALQEAQEWGSAAVLIAAIVVGVIVFLSTKNEYAAIWIVVIGAVFAAVIRFIDPIAEVLVPAAFELFFGIDLTTGGAPPAQPAGPERAPGA